ncbi:MAG: RNA-binding protein [Bacteroidales bacterium]|nr:RNA-binding protein [Bacteroidales bacterium]
MNIYVGNLDYKVNEDDLKNIFDDYGKVSDAVIISDKFTSRSKGFGFVTMENQTEGQKAIEELNGASYENRTMVVNEARPKKNNY